ncbi:MAG: GatB/YqeY domain-containing protein [Pseudomonadota bacterium]|jgi:uncharacterized protein
MVQPNLKQRLAEAVKTAMRARERARVDALRLIQAEIQRIEIDERIVADDTRVLAVLDRMTKQRRDAIAQYQAAGRAELAAREQAEIDVIAEFLPEPLSDAEIDALIAAAIAQSGAGSARDLGKVMALLKPQLQGRADLGAVSARVKNQLG